MLVTSMNSGYSSASIILNAMYALVDCNNFYVSCERVFAPQLEGRPVVVLSNNDDGLISRSDEAKGLGLKMGEPYHLARPLLETTA